MVAHDADVAFCVEQLKRVLLEPLAQRLHFVSAPFFLFLAVVLHCVRASRRIDKDLVLTDEACDLLVGFAIGDFERYYELRLASLRNVRKG